MRLAGLAVLVLVGSSPAAEPIYQWRFTADHAHNGGFKPLAGNLEARLPGTVRFSSEAPRALALDGDLKNKRCIEITDRVAAVNRPARTITLEAWARVERVQDWGGFVSLMQDNGPFERGWILGYSKNQFSFGLVSQKTSKITYLKSRLHFIPGYWYHIAGTYDGTTMRLFVDGQLQAESREQSGDILYPPRAWFVAGAYRDDDEFYPLAGQLESVAVFDRPLTAAEIGKRFADRKSLFPDIEGTPPDVADWPTHLRDAQRTGISRENLKFPLRRQWVHRSPLPPRPSWPPPARHDYWHSKFNLDERVTYDHAYHVVSVGDRLWYGSSADDHVYCLNARTGAVLWRFRTEGPVRLAPTVAGDRLLFGSDDGHVYCLALKDGALLWKRLLGPEGRRIPGNGRVISAWPVRTGVLFEDGAAWACAGVFPSQGVYQVKLDPRDGKVLESQTLSVTAQGYLEQSGSRLFVPTGRDPAGAFVSKLNRRGKPVGKEVSSIPTEYPHAFIGAGDVRIGGGDGKLAAFRVRDGSKVWSAEVEGRVLGLAVSRGRLFASTDRGFLYCFSPAEPAGNEVNLALPWDQAGLAIPEAVQALAAWYLQKAGVDRGYCLLLGAGDGLLACALARRGRLQVIVREPDAGKIAQVQAVVENAGLAGQVFLHQGSLEELPYTDYLFNLVIAGPAGKRSEVLRVTRPSGGVAIFGNSDSAVVRKGPLRGAGEWSHFYGDPGNSACSGDQLLEGELKLQWFGQPGPRPMIDRHHRTASPLYRDGRLFVPGEDRVIGVDAYNGTILWDRSIPNSRRVVVFRDCSYLAAGADRLYIAAADQLLALDPQTGQTRQTLYIPEVLRKEKREWGYVGVLGEVLVGSAVLPGSSRREQSTRLTQTETHWDEVPAVGSHSLFGLGARDGKVLWTYSARGLILNPTIALAEGKVLFIESASSQTLARGRAKLPEVLGKGCFLVALDLKTGRELYRRPRKELASIQHNLYLSCARGRVVLAGSRNTGPDKKKDRLLFELLVLDAGTGEPVWARTQNQNQPIGGDHGEQDVHPVIVGDKLYLEPAAYDLHTGRPVDWKWPFARKKRSGCGTISASASRFFFRNNNIAGFDLSTGKLSALTTETRPGCWINLIPAGGLLLAPEASSGCTCNYSVQTSLALIPVPKKN